jgi:dienelactone hydrolase
MRSISFLFAGLYFCTQAVAQKPLLDSSTFDKWPRLNNIKITDDGRYSMYAVIDRLHGTNTLTVRSNHHDWTETLSSSQFRSATFTSDSRMAFFLNGHDSLGSIILGQPTIHYIPHIRSFTLSGGRSPEWLAYLDTAKNLTLREISGPRQMSYSLVRYYALNPGGTSLLLQTGPTESLIWIDLATDQSVSLSNKSRASHFTFSSTGQALAYTISDTLFYFQAGMPNAAVLLANTPKGLDSETFNPDGGLAFNQSGDRLLIKLQDAKMPLVSQTTAPRANVDIWNYRDEYLPSEQLSNYARYNSRFPKEALINVKTGQAFLVNDGNARLLNRSYFNHYLLAVIRPCSDRGYYDTADRPKIAIISAENGNALFIKKILPTSQPSLSPDEHFLLWFDSDSLHFFSYDIQAHTLRNVSKLVPSALYDEEAVVTGNRNASFEVGAWDTLHRAVYLYDKYDLWKVSLDGSNLPVNLTNGYGRKNRIVFGIPEPPYTSQHPVLTAKEPLVLSGYDPRTKDNGFWNLDPLHHSDPKAYVMEPYCYFITRTGSIGNIAYAKGNIFLKARHAPCYLVQKMSAEEYPNLYFTQNFRNYRPLSDLHPERAYHWFHARLLTWTMSDGRLSQGILYLPEQFDSTKKYPLLLNYYEKESDEFHQYKVPEVTGDLINVPYYVSNGYIMFLPDIYYQQGHNGKGVLNAVLSAVRYLSNLPWIDSTKIGIQGHSFGGWETNYLITHSHLFAAAGEGAGVADQISGYDQLSLASGSSRQSFYETGSQGGPFGIGVTPWTRPDIYMENSPIFSVGSVTTPLLMMHGDADPSVPFAQAIEMYLALQRAGKKVWLLQYEHASHALSNYDAVDYTLRLKQYFDYYLKGALPPRWMTQGVPSALKGFDSGLELDSSGTLP